jgi:hypothetical protein
MVSRRYGVTMTEAVEVFAAAPFTSVVAVIE